MTAFVCSLRVDGPPCFALSSLISPRSITRRNEPRGAITQWQKTVGASAPFMLAGRARVLCFVHAIAAYDDPHDPAHDNVIFNPQYSLLKISHRSSS